MKERASARGGVEHRHPFHDRRLIELALALPPEQLWRGDQSKFILRQAMKGLVPDAILQRRTKAEFSAVCAQVYESERMAPLFHSSRIAEQGWIEHQARVTAMYREFRDVEPGPEGLSSPRLAPGHVLASMLWFRAASLTDAGMYFPVLRPALASSVNLPNSLIPDRPTPNIVSA